MADNRANMMGGMAGKASKALSGRARQIDDAVDAAVSGSNSSPNESVPHKQNFATKHPKMAPGDGSFDVDAMERQIYNNSAN